MNYDDIFANTGNSNVEILEKEVLRGQQIRPYETPSNAEWRFVPLLSNDGSVSNTWQIGNSLVLNSKITVQQPNKLYIIDNGKIITINSENELSDARKIYLEKYKEGYVPYGSELPSHLTGPMLAKIYCSDNNENNSENKSEKNDEKNKTKITKFPVSVMRKIDGIRCLSKMYGNQIKMRSRLNNLFPHLQHIKDELINYMRYLPPYCELDGELFHIEFPLTLITSIVKNIKQLHQKHNELQYWIFDVMDPQNMGWEQRYAMLVNAYIKFIEDGNSCKYIKILQAYNVNNSQEIETYHNKFVSEGYEGLVIRRYEFVDPLLSKYKSGRNNALVKYKVFQDEEVVIINLIENKYLVRNSKGLQFLVKMRYEKYCEKNIGKELTIRYKGSMNGIPINSIGVVIRDYE